MNHTTNKNSFGEDLFHTNQTLAMAYVPFQMSSFENLYEPDEALCKGTIFPELYLPKLGMEAKK